MSTFWSWAEIRRKLYFAAIGVIAVVANFGTNQMLQAVEVALWLAGPIGFIAGGQVNFFLHNFVTWRDRHPTMEGWLRRWRWFMAGNVIGMVINTVALLSYSHHIHNALVPFFGALVTSSVFNWFWNDRLSFAHHPLEPPEEALPERSD